MTVVSIVSVMRHISLTPRTYRSLGYTFVLYIFLELLKYNYKQEHEYETYIWSDLHMYMIYEWLGVNLDSFNVHI